MDPQLSGLALILTGYQSFTAPPNHRNNRYFRHKAALSEELSSTSLKSPFYLKPNFKTLLVVIVNEYSFYFSRLVPHFLNLLVFGTSTSSKMYVAFHSRKFYKRNETKCLRIRGLGFQSRKLVLDNGVTALQAFVESLYYQNSLKMSK